MVWYKNLPVTEQDFFQLQEEKREEEGLFMADSELEDIESAEACLCGHKPQAGFYLLPKDAKRWRCACTNTECPVIMDEGWHDTKSEAVSAWRKFLKVEKQNAKKK